MIYIYVIFFVDLREVVERLPDNPPPLLYRYRRHVWNDTEEAYEAYKSCYTALGHHLRNGIDVNSLPLRCTGDCNCIVQQGPVGDRGSFCSRIVPCARTELVSKLKFNLCNIRHVSLLNHAYSFMFLFWIPKCGSYKFMLVYI